METLQKILTEIAYSLNNWEPGDLIGLSALSDLVECLEKNPDADLTVHEIASQINSLVKEALGGNEFCLNEAVVSFEKIQAHLEAQDVVSPDQEPEATDSDFTAKAYINNETIQMFLSEAHERITEAQALVLEWESGVFKPESVDSLFRIFHTIKGECGFLKIVTLGELSHHIEGLLDALRRGETEVNEDFVDLLFTGIDHARVILENLSKGEVVLMNKDAVDDYLNLIQQKGGGQKKAIGDMLVEDGKLSETDVQKILQKQKISGFTKKFGQIAEEEQLVSKEEIRQVIEQQDRPDGGPNKNDSLVKVKASQVNFLVDMIGELLIIENQLDEKDKNVIQLKKISKSLQAAAMKLRTVSVRSLFINMKRIARDAAKKLNKEINLVTQGDDLEIDRNLVEALEEPLMHIVRNAIGHGIEESSVRSSSGKSKIGTVTVRAFRQGNTIVISVRDDGKGLDQKRIWEKAVEKNLVSADRQGSLPKEDIYNFIFLPGFSTAENVNAISGRGVGMDIVKKSVTNSRGKIEILSEPGNFTEFQLVFPLSLAIIDGMIVEVDKIPFIIPVASIIESLKVNPGQISTVEGNLHVLNLRGEVIPIIQLEEYFYGKRAPANGSSHEKFVVIIESEKQKIALMVDAIIAKKEIVIKSLGKKFTHLDSISSATVLPGGKIGFVVNIDEIIKNSGEAS